MIKEIFKYLIARFTEPSTMASISAILLSLNITLANEYLVVSSVLFGTLGIILKDKGK